MRKTANTTVREFRKDYGGDEMKLSFLSDLLGWFHHVPLADVRTSHMSATLHDRTHSQEKTLGAYVQQIMFVYTFPAK